ncbi:MAG: glutathione S-transferase [Deltaproteobacteria bacterium]
MKLFYSPASPFVRKVMIVLHETGLIAQTELVRSSGNAIEPGTMPLDQNPLGKIPTLLLNDGRAIYDSRVITRFLNDTVESDLYPDDARKWDCLTLEALGDGMSDAAILCVYEKRLRPDEKWHQPFIDGQWNKISRALDQLEARHMPYLQSGFDIAHAAMASALGYIDFRLPERNWRDTRPALTRWAQSIATRPSIAVTAPSG